MTILDYTLPTDGLAGCFIDGHWHWPESGKKLGIENPSRRDIICEIGHGTAPEIDLAVAAAEKARRAWAALAGAERGRMLTELGNRMSANAEEFARLLAAETGNAIKTQARGEANGAAARAETLWRRRGRAKGRDVAARSRPFLLHHPRAARRGRLDHSLERAACSWVR